tara:strand:+ start:1428 stop:1823 length:396 start_codon:yes stop_codon:yes gene_type:complete
MFKNTKYGIQMKVGEWVFSIHVPYSRAFTHLDDVWAPACELAIWPEGKDGQGSWVRWMAENEKDYEVVLRSVDPERLARIINSFMYRMPTVALELDNEFGLDRPYGEWLDTHGQTHFKYPEFNGKPYIRGD